MKAAKSRGPLHVPRKLSFPYDYPYFCSPDLVTISEMHLEDAVSTPTAEETTIFNVSNCLEADILIHWTELYKNKSPVLKSESSGAQGELLRRFVDPNQVGLKKSVDPTKYHRILQLVSNDVPLSQFWKDHWIMSKIPHG